MSFDIFVGAFHLGERASFSADVLLQAFGPHLDPSSVADAASGAGWVTYPASDSAEDEADGAEIMLHRLGDGAVEGFSVNRPPGAIAFWASVLAVLQNARAALYWPGENALVIGREDTAAHLPADMIEALGAPFLARTGEEIVQRLESS